MIGNLARIGRVADSTDIARKTFGVGEIAAAAVNDRRRMTRSATLIARPMYTYAVSSASSTSVMHAS